MAERNSETPSRSREGYAPRSLQNRYKIPPSIRRSTPLSLRQRSPNQPARNLVFVGRETARPRVPQYQALSGTDSRR